MHPRLYRSFVPILVPVASALALALALPLAPVRAQDPIDATLRLARPEPSEERWRLIPWRTSLTDALREGARVERPVFYFGYDGILDVGNC